MCGAVTVVLSQRGRGRQRLLRYPPGAAPLPGQNPPGFLSDPSTAHGHKELGEKSPRGVGRQNKCRG